MNYNKAKQSTVKRGMPVLYSADYCSIQFSNRVNSPLMQDTKVSVFFIYSMGLVYIKGQFLY